MLLRNMLAGMDYTLVQGSLDIEIGSLVLDSRKAAEGALFVCICGSRMDAHRFIPDVASKGAAAVVIEREQESLPEGLTVLKVTDSRLALAELSAAYFDHPTRKMTCVGLTGTKGKTTTTYMIKAILEKAGKKVGLVGTNGAVIDGVLYPTRNTTPESYDLQEFFDQMVRCGCEYMIMEVSSQGLKMNRVAGIHFDLGIFTNIFPDHIGPDEHADFEEYLDCKCRLFSMSDRGLVNRDDAYCDTVLEKAACPMTTFGMDERSELRAEHLIPVHREGFMGVAFDYSGKAHFPLQVSTPGLFSVHNGLCAAAAAETLGIAPAYIQEALQEVKVAGRMELVYASDRCSVIVDYAHNGGAARVVLETLKEYDPRRLVVVFGCGGNRDPHRRYEMGEAAGSMADLSIVTADNSRYEKVEDIMKDIHIGLDPTGGSSIDIPDRRDAIRYSIVNSQPGDVIAIIGKGHEDYQEVNGVRTHFLDREEAEKVLRELGWI